MKHRVLITAMFAVVTVLGSSADAWAAPSGPSTIAATIGQLRSLGYQVVVDRFGTAPLDQCTVRASMWPADQAASWPSVLRSDE